MRRVLRYGQNLTITPTQAKDTAPPGSGATITVGVVEIEVQNDPTFFCLAMISSADSGASGVIFEVSFDDGVSWETQKLFSYATASNVVVYAVPVCGDRHRVRYVNSANVLTKWKGRLFLTRGALPPT